MRDATAHRSNYGDGVWDLTPLGVAAGAGAVLLYFQDPQRGQKVLLPPEQFIPTSKRVAYLLINDGMPQAYVNRFRSSARAHMAPGSIKNAMRDMRPLFEWLGEQGIECLADCSPQMLHEYALWVTTNKPSHRRQFYLLQAVERLHHLAPLLPDADQLVEPPFAAKDALNSGSSPAPGAARSVILPTVGDPLLTFAITCVRSLAVDIFAATDTVAALTANPPQPSEGASELLRRLAASGGIPAAQRKGQQSLAADYLATVYGLRVGTVVGMFRRLGLQASLNADIPCPVPVPILGRLGDAPWVDHIDWYDAAPRGDKRGLAPLLLTHLQVACWIILADLTGARPEEVRQLPRNSCQVIEGPGGLGAVRHVLWGARRKGVTDASDQASVRGADK